MRASDTSALGALVWHGWDNWLFEFLFLFFYWQQTYLSKIIDCTKNVPFIRIVIYLMGEWCHIGMYGCNFQWSRYLNWWLYFCNWTIMNKGHENFKWNSLIFIQKISLENAVCNMESILFRVYFVKIDVSCMLFQDWCWILYPWTACGWLTFTDKQNAGYCFNLSLTYSWTVLFGVFNAFHFVPCNRWLFLQT